MEQKIIEDRVKRCNNLYNALNSITEFLCKDIERRFELLKAEKIYRSNGSVEKEMKLPFQLNHYSADTIRYFVISNLEETEENKFSLENLVLENNNKLLGILGNYINRCLIYVKRYFGGKLPASEVDAGIKKYINDIYDEVGQKIEKKNFDSALEEIFKFIKKANDYFDRNQPWVQVDENRAENEVILYNCVIIIGNLSNMLEPFMPESACKIRKSLGITEQKWGYIEETNLIEVNKLSALFDWMDIDTIRDDIKKYNCINS